MLIVQPLKSVITTEYVPEATFNKSCVVAPFDHKYVNGAVPPVWERSIEPFDCPLQRTFVTVVVGVKEGI